MREIEFISRHPKNSLRAYGEISNRWGFSEHGYFHTNGLPDSQYIQCQYTNMKDKKGVKIYEGDVVRIEIETCQGNPWGETFSLVGYSQGEVVIHKRFGVSLTNFFTWDEEGDVLFSHNLKAIKTISSYRSLVVGNIYQNPELLIPKITDNGQTSN